MSTAPATRGRPRSTEADAAIVQATLDLLLEVGYRALSVEQVARRAGVGKATIYRRHRTKQDVVAAAVRHLHSDLQVPPDSGSLRTEFAAVAGQAAAMGSRTGFLTFVPRMLAEASSDPELHAVLTASLVEPRREVLRAVVIRAKARGEVREDVDTEVAIDLMAGPIVYRILLGGLDMPQIAAFSDAILEAALEGLRPR